MRPDASPEMVESSRLAALNQVWVSIDALTEAIVLCYQCGKYETARNLGMVVGALWEIVKPVPEG